MTSIFDSEIGRKAFKQNEPHVLLLSFRTLELAKDYYLSLLQDNEAIEHQLILLCTASETELAIQFSVANLVSDYCVIQPFSDPGRLYMCVQHALNRWEIRRKYDMLNQELSETETHLKITTNSIHEMLDSNPELQRKSVQALEELTKGIDKRLDDFEQKMLSPEFSDMVQVIDSKKLSQRFSELKNQVLQQELEGFEEKLSNLNHSLLRELKVYMGEPALLEKQTVSEVSEEYIPSSASILIIDDEAEVAEELEVIFKSEKYVVNHARTMQEAMHQALKERPDLILVNVLMPKVNGIELTLQFKKRFQLRDIPIIMMSEYSSKKVVHLSFHAGASDFIVMPISHNVLLEKIQKFVS